ncbi:hypothetical protein ACTG2M_13465 [Aeromonas veronii]|uniref:hypothetical protein n=1 Tax=Aeromonas veronii TaxID=654 RepID=UPI003F796A2F
MSKLPTASNNERKNKVSTSTTDSKKLELDNVLFIKQTSLEAIQCTNEAYTKSSAEIEKRRLEFQQRKAKQNLDFDF